MHSSQRRERSRESLPSAGCAGCAWTPSIKRAAMAQRGSRGPRHVEVAVDLAAKLAGLAGLWLPLAEPAERGAVARPGGRTARLLGRRRPPMPMARWQRPARQSVSELAATEPL